MISTGQHTGSKSGASDRETEPEECASIDEGVKPDCPFFHTGGSDG